MEHRWNLRLDTFKTDVFFENKTLLWFSLNGYMLETKPNQPLNGVHVYLDFEEVLQCVVVFSTFWNGFRISSRESSSTECCGHWEVPGANKKHRFFQVESDLLQKLKLDAHRNLFGNLLVSLHMRDLGRKTARCFKCLSVLDEFRFPNSWLPYASMCMMKEQIHKLNPFPHWVGSSMFCSSHIN